MKPFKKESAWYHVIWTSPFCAISVQNLTIFGGLTQWCDVKPIFVLMEMADRAGDGSTKLQINF